MAKIRRTALLAAIAVAASLGATAQTLGPPAPAAPYAQPAYGSPAHSPPPYRPPAYSQPAYGSPTHGAPSYDPPGYSPPSPIGALQGPFSQGVSASDAEGLRAALNAAKSGDGAAIRAAMTGLYDPLARKIALWAMADATPESMGPLDLDEVRRELVGWPRTDRRQIAAANRLVVAAADAEFEAGWIALTRLNDPRGADAHFARLQTMGQSPLTQSRALYWRGRAAEAMGDPVGAQLFYAQAAHYQTTFYGQLAAAKSGAAVITLGRDPVITAGDRAGFESLEPVRAARLLAQVGANGVFKTFVAALSDSLPTASDEAQLVDLARGWGDQELAMRVVRNAARRDLILPERGYPIRAAPTSFNAPEAPFILGIVRQESSFDPRAHSGAGARGMMQLMPATAQVVAGRLGLGYGDLDDPTYNMTVGSAFLGQLVRQFDGSYVMAAAAYNAGPGRPPQWAMACGDPRSAATDPVNFIECIPFSETRDYVMRVLEATEVYRARLNGGTAPDTLIADLKRGGYGYGSFGPAAGVAGASP